MKNERTQKDYDIISQSSLKAAVELTIGILPRLDNETEISDLVLKLANKFSTWVLGDTVQNQETGAAPTDHPDPSSLNGFQDYSFAENSHIQSCFHEIHILQDGLGMPRTDFFSDCPTHPSWKDAANDLVKKLRKQVHEALAYGKNPGGNGGNGNRDRGNGNGNGNGNGGGGPLTKKQYGFIIGLHKELGQEPDRAEIDQMTVGEASDYIEGLKAMTTSGGGNGGYA